MTRITITKSSEADPLQMLVREVVTIALSTSAHRSKLTSLFLFPTDNSIGPMNRYFSTVFLCFSRSRKIPFFFSLRLIPLKPREYVLSVRSLTFVSFLFARFSKIRKMREGKGNGISASCHLLAWFRERNVAVVAGWRCLYSWWP